MHCIAGDWNDVLHLLLYSCGLGFFDSFVCLLALTGVSGPRLICRSLFPSGSDVAENIVIAWLSGSCALQLCLY